MVRLLNCEYIDGHTFCELNFLKTNNSEKSKPANSVIVWTCFIDEIKILLIQLDKSYKMGTIGVSEGEIITLAFEYAARKKLPVITVAVSGGIRVNEGSLALMQMTKMATVVKQHSDKGLLYISIITNPTLGGTSASFASLADIIIAEKGAVFGFSGKRIIMDTTREKLPDDFQTAEYAKKHGMVDIVADKSEIKCIVSKLLNIHKNR